MSNIKGLKIKNIDVYLVFVILLFVFNFLLYNITLDYNEHLKAIIKVNKGNAYYSPNFLFYYIINLFSGFSTDINTLRDVAVLVLAIATTFKFVLTKKILLTQVENIDYKFTKNTVSLIAFCILFAFAIPDYYTFFRLNFMYLGKIPPVVWHNSTLSLVFPFTLLLFLQHLKMDKKNESNFFTRDNLILISLIAANIFIKPSFIFVYIPVAGLLIIQKNGLKDLKRTILQLLPLAIGLCILFGQYVLIYFFQIGSFQAGDSSITIGKPFEFWIINKIPYWYIPIGLLLSYIFPLTTYAFYRDIIKFRPFFICLCYTLVSFLISTFIVENGPRRFHGNFTWQGIICSYFLLVTTTMYLLPKLYTQERFSSRFFILGIVFISQFLSGILYFLKLYYTKFLA